MMIRVTTDMPDFQSYRPEGDVCPVLELANPFGGTRQNRPVQAFHEGLAVNTGGAFDQAGRVDRVSCRTRVRIEQCVRKGPQKQPGTPGVIQVDMRDEQALDPVRREPFRSSRLHQTGYGVVRVALDEKSAVTINQQIRRSEFIFDVFAIHDNDPHNVKTIMGLKILTWNISYAHGNGSEGAPGWKRHPAVHYENALSAMATLIRNTGTDVALLQEVDFDSNRSHRRNQLDTLARRSGLLHRSHCTSWNLPWVPYPGWNPLNHFGKVRSGGGILSRFPIRNLQVDLLPKPRENPDWYNRLYLHRYFQFVETGGLRIVNLHLEAFSNENRSLHLMRLGERIRDFSPDLCGGDFNGSIEIDANLQSEFDVLPAPGPTFPTPEARERLDGFILKKSRFIPLRIEVPDTGTFSDHFPVLIEIEESSKNRPISPRV
jgi:endonuclease/exonuclease/phosphatase family metal-dependent hydrolase